MSSRGAWFGAIVALFVGGIFYGLFRFGWKLVLLNFLVLLVGGLLWFAAVPENRPTSLTQTVNLSEANVNLRFFVWDIAGQAMLDHPLFGVGPGQFQYFFQSHRGKNLSDQSSVFDDPHNLFLELGATLGIPVLLANLALLAVLLVLATEQSRKEHDPLPLVLAISLLSFCAMASFTPVSSACFLLLAVLIAGIVLPQAKVREVSLRPLFLAACFLVGVIFIAGGVVFLTSELIFYKSNTDYNLGNYQSAYRLSSLAQKLNPENQIFSVVKASSEIQLGFPTAQTDAQIPQLIALYPQDARGYLYGANMQFLLYSKTGDKKFLEQAIATAGQAASLDPYNASRYEQLALYYYGDNNLDTARAIVEYSLSLDKNSASAWVLLAKIFQLQKNYRASREALQQVYELQQANPLVQSMYEQSKKISDKDYSKLEIPVFVNPGQIE